jgi:hypothetical protein
VKARKIHPNSKPRFRPEFQNRMPAVPRGWRAKLVSALHHRIGTVLTADEVRELALIAGVREAGR